MSETSMPPRPPSGAVTPIAEAHDLALRDAESLASVIHYVGLILGGIGALLFGVLVFAIVFTLVGP